MAFVSACCSLFCLRTSSRCLQCLSPPPPAIPRSFAAAFSFFGERKQDQTHVSHVCWPGRTVPVIYSPRARVMQMPNPELSGASQNTALHASPAAENSVFLILALSFYQLNQPFPLPIPVDRNSSLCRSSASELPFDDVPAFHSDNYDLCG